MQFTVSKIGFVTLVVAHLAAAYTPTQLYVGQYCNHHFNQAVTTPGKCQKVAGLGIASANPGYGGIQFYRDENCQNELMTSGEAVGCVNSCYSTVTGDAAGSYKIYASDIGCGR